MVVLLYHCKMTPSHQVGLQMEHNRALILNLSLGIQDVLSYIKGTSSHSEITSCMVL